MELKEMNEAFNRIDRLAADDAKQGLPPRRTGLEILKRLGMVGRVPSGRWDCFVIWLSYRIVYRLNK